MGSAAQRDTARKNLEAARETNAMNYRMFLEGRGSTGHAFLPMYFGDQERKIAGDATQFYNQSRELMGSPSQQLQKYTAVMDEFKPMQQAATASLGDVYNGNMTNARLGYLKPVQDARLGAAAGQKQAIFQGLQQRINALSAQQAAKGFSGTGSFAQNRMLDSTIGARQMAANTMSEAELANAVDQRGVMDQQSALRLEMLDRPYQMAGNALNMEMMPMAQVQSNFSRALQPFEFFRMGPDSFKADQLPQTPYIPSAAQIALTGIGAANQQAAQYFMNRQAANQYSQNAANAYAGYNYGSSVPSNWSSLNSAQQGAYMQQLGNASQYQGMFE